MSRSYFVRITPNQLTTIDDMVDMIESLLITKYFVCYEQASRPHFHLCLWTDRSPENMRYNLKSKVNGQVYISGKEIEDKVKAIAYCMKDGVYRQKNIDILTFMMAKQTTRKKESFDDDMKAIMDKCLDEMVTVEYLVTKIVDLYVKYNRKIYRQHIRALAELIKAKRCPYYRQELVKNIIAEY